MRRKEKIAGEEIVNSAIIDKTYYFIRHAVPVNDDRSFHISGFEKDMAAKMDEALSAIGRKQAKACSEYVRGLDCEIIISSNMQRAIETADIIAKGSGVKRGAKYPELREIAPGTLPVKTFYSYKFATSKLWPHFIRRRLCALLETGLTIYYLYNWREKKTENGEPFQTVLNRIDALFHKLKKRPEKRIALVGHGYWIITMALYVTGRTRWHVPRLGWVGNCSVTKMTLFRDGRLHLEYFGKRTF